MKLITWNIQWGLGMDGRVDLQRIAHDARALADFDVLCLQEVADGFTDLKASRGENQFAELATLLPDHTAIEGIAVDLPKPGGGRRRFGNMILSRLPIGRIVQHALPWAADAASRNMPRTLLEVEVQAAFGPVRVMTTHLEYFSATLRSQQVAAIREVYRLAAARARTPPSVGDGPYASSGHPAATILTGDFNMKPDDATKASLSLPDAEGHAGFADAWLSLHPDTPHPPSFCIADQTYGTPHCCDYVWLSADLVPRLRDVVYQTQTRASDHQPVLVELEN